MENQSISSKVMIDANQKIKERDYWLEKLSGELGKCSFPYDSFRTDPNKRIKENVEFKITGKLFTRLMEISNQSDVRLFIVFLTGLVELMEKYTGNTDIILGAPVNKQESQSNFLNTVLILRNIFNTNMTFKELLLMISQTFAEASEHVNYPIEALLYQLNIPYNTDADFPLLDVAVLLENIQEKSYLDHLHLNMVFSFLRTAECIEGRVEFDAGLYDKSKIEKIIFHFENLLSSCLFDLNLSLKQINILSEEEEKQILAQFNDTGLDYPSDKTIHQIFEEWVRRSPQTLAVAHKEDGLTYQQLNLKANQLADLLRQKGVKENSMVALMVDRSVEMMIGILGILKAGGAYVPINPENPEQRIQYMLEDCGADILLTLEQYAAGSYSQEVINLENPSVYNGNPENVEGIGAPHTLAYSIYTSGSTGKPKGVLIEHHHVNVLVSGLHHLIYSQYGEKLKVALVAPYVFDASVQQIFGALLLGHSLYIVPEDVRVDGELMLRFFAENQIEISDGTPSHIKMMLDSVAGNTGGLCLEHLIIGGEALPQKATEMFLKGFTEKVPKITNVYGPAECCVDVTAFEITRDNITESQVIPIGKPMPNRLLYVLNREENLQPVGVIGEICISGGGIGRGYLKREELTREKFVPNPYVQGMTMYKTGDLGRWLPDGNIEFVGRLDHQIKIRGFRIELGEIENLLLEHEDITESLVLARTDEDGDKYLYCYFVANAEYNSAQLREYLASSLPEYMIPSFFIQMESFPLTVNGKVDLKALPEPDLNAGLEKIAPRDDLESKLAEIWAEVLKVDIDNIGINSDFFALGGHSLKATTLISKIHKQFSVKVPIAQIFETPELKGLSEYIKGTSEVKFFSIPVAEKKPYYSLSSAQQRFYFLQQMDPESTAYNIPQGIVLKDKPDMPKLTDAFRRLVERHESLRTSFDMKDDEPVQIVHEEFPFDVQYFESDEQNTMEVLKKFVVPFDLTKAPLVRVAVINIANLAYLLAVDMHHIISDGVSVNVLIEDLEVLHSGMELPELRLHYKDFSEWQNSDEQQAEIEKQREYWLNKFEGDLPVLDMPADHPYPAVRKFEGHSVHLEIDQETTAALRDLAFSEETTPYMVMLAVYNITMAKICAKEDIIVGTAIAGRVHADLARVIGLFFNTLALRNFPAKEKVFKDFLKETTQGTLEAFENQDYAFERLVQELQDQGRLVRDPARNPLFDTMFAFDNFEVPSDKLLGLGIDEERTKDYNYRDDSSKFDMLFNVLEKTDTIVITIDYSTILFEQSTIDSLLEYYMEVLDQAIEDRELTIGDIKISRDSMDIKPGINEQELSGFNF